MSFDEATLENKPIESVQLDSLALLKVIKHCREGYQSFGYLVGVDVCGELQVSFGFPMIHDQDEDMSQEQYKELMLKQLDEFNYDTKIVGWYQSTYLSSWWNQQLIEQQYKIQKENPLAVVLLLDPLKTSNKPLDLTCMRLTQNFMDLYQKETFKMASIVQIDQLFESVPLKIRNPHLLGALTKHINFVNLSKSFEFDSAMWIEKHLEVMADTLDDHGQEQWKWQQWQRNLQREQVRNVQNKERMKQENVQAAEQGKDQVWQEYQMQEDLPSLIKAIGEEPSRFESLLLGKQLETFATKLQQFSGN
ncbi:hypothetical protein EDD86DRAFT_186375 [Gorgonomyces haynaldii]|nr:hypothetical protein EDD86DRAFT_186375 [Gorgonomyces haynaldii]